MQKTGDLYIISEESLAFKNFFDRRKMRKPKIYLDTSVISYLDQQDSPEKMEETRQFWNILKQENYEVCLSDINKEELFLCSKYKLEILNRYLSEISFILLTESEESVTLAKAYLSHAVLTGKSFTDCRHIALATLNECDYIVSWNFKHMVNIHTVQKVKGLNQMLGYKTVEISMPSFFLF